MAPTGGALWKGRAAKGDPVAATSVVDASEPVSYTKDTLTTMLRVVHRQTDLSIIRLRSKPEIDKQGTRCYIVRTKLL